MKKYRPIGHFIIHVLDSAVNVCIVTVLVLMFLSGLYILWDSNQIYTAAASVNYTAYRPSTESSHTFEELESMNPEVFGWLSVYGTQIDYPIVQGTDNEKYLNTNAEGNYSLSGALFLDYENSPDFSDFNSIIFGHHMDQGAMFGEVDLFKDQSFLNTHRYGSLYYDGTQYGLELFCYLDADAYDTGVYGIVHSETGREDYLDSLISKSLSKTDASVSSSDQLVLLSTCSTTSTNGRHILVGKITEEVQPDTFIQEETINKGTGIDAGSNWIQYLRNLGSWIWIIPLFLLVLIILLILYRKKRRKDR